MTPSIATPGLTSAGVPQLVRTWKPEGDPWANVLIVHGLGEHSGRYERTGGLMAEAGLAVTSFDLVGFGASGGKRGHIDTWTTYLDQVQGHLESQARPLVLLGHSMGGAIALEYALSERPQADLLVLSAPALGGGAAWQRKLAPIAAKALPGIAVPNALKGEQLSRDPAVGAAYFADPLVLLKSTTRLGAELFASMDRSTAALHSLNLRTLVLHGGLDTIVPPTSTVALEAVAERRLLPKLRHEILNEPEGPEVVAQIVAWIKENVSG